MYTSVDSRPIRSVSFVSKHIDEVVFVSNTVDGDRLCEGISEQGCSHKIVLTFFSLDYGLCICLVLGCLARRKQSNEIRSG